MARVTSLASVRADRAAGRKELSCEDLFHLLLADLNCGEFAENSKVLVLVLDEASGENGTVHDYRTRLTKSEEAQLLNVYCCNLIRELSETEEN